MTLSVAPRVWFSYDDFGKHISPNQQLQIYFWGNFPGSREGVGAEVFPNNPRAALRGGVRNTGGGCAHRLHFYASLVRLRLHGAVTPDLDFTDRITPSYLV